MKITHTEPGRKPPWLMTSIAFVAVVVSVGLAAIGVVGLVGIASPLAVAGTAALILGTLVSELAACRLPVHAESRAREGAWAKGGAAIVVFALLTAWNVTAGHLGMAAIERQGLADQRAPLERAAFDAAAAHVAAEEALAAHDAESARLAALWSGGLAAVDPRYVTAGTRRLEAAAQAAEARGADRTRLVEALAAARAADQTAQAALAGAAKPRPDHELWAFALLLEILKGALVWIATGRERKGGAAVVALPSKAPAEMSEAELKEMASRGASLAATARHELARRKAA